MALTKIVEYVVKQLESTFLKPTENRELDSVKLYIYVFVLISTAFNIYAIKHLARLTAEISSYTKELVECEDRVPSGLPPQSLNHTGQISPIFKIKNTNNKLTEETVQY